MVFASVLSFRYCLCLAINAFVLIEAVELTENDSLPVEVITNQ